jgi:hypothetical protein
LVLDGKFSLHVKIDKKFIIEGALTIILGIVSFWIITDFPIDARFLTPVERQVVISRLRDDGQASSRDETFNWSAVKASLTDWKTYTGMIFKCGESGPLYAFALFLPSIINGLGFSPLVSQLMTVPPYMAAVFGV